MCDCTREQCDSQSPHTREHTHGHTHSHTHAQAEEGACACGGPKAAKSGCGCRDSHAGGGHDHDHGEFNWTWRIIVPGALFGLGLAVRGMTAGTAGLVAFYALMLAAYLLCGVPVLREAGETIRRRDFFNEFTLMSLATLVAMGIGEMAEAVGVMLFYSLGEAVQDKAAGKSRRSIRSLLASKPEVARVVRDGAAVETRPEEVEIGSLLLVKPGEKVPLDGVVESGSANMDLSSLTGESAPAVVGPGDGVYSGAISLDGDLTVRTTEKYANSMVGKILAMVENAVAMKSRTERFITVFARYYTPAVTAAAALVAVVPPLVAGGAWGEWIYRGLVLLVVSCPCALLLSVPLAFFAGIGAASRKGMLVKGGQVFDALARAKSVVFDKTGTLTRGRPALVGTEPAAGVEAGELLRLAALAESRSNHPVARAVAEAAGGGELREDVTLRDVAGKGVVATAKEGEILVGNAALLRDAGVAFAEDAGTGMVAYVALNGTYLGRLAFADGLKDGSAAAMRELRAGGMSLYMLTGDRREAAEAVAAELELDGYRAGLLPDGKVAAFRELSPGGEAVFVGDGVNDAPVLASSGVGVAMGALGSAAAVEAADAVILDDRIERIPDLFAVARRTRRVAGENIAFALAVKTVVMLLGVAGISGLWSAVFADVGVALLAVLNSLRLAR